ncbi:adenylate/guanylate cyclase domain-containing protein [Sphaerospermopsis aphanizomenoides BCCUSP55]|uniref:CHASE2 domain-containing protein n=1 Tax=Sphaerospermopsis aphanizomenoides TaxID=459663 RepID=UPI0019042107|nr:adenylate/guanylate cyclase domain-containing protein [Sphaerospermopsis aphanizomenoides]MBK1990356.1 adenylate/guanylate cyclase domain-containing protein [Sphaerospermopsis aphanizomenoides BCCUSP55]
MNFLPQKLKQAIWEWRGVLIAVPNITFVVIAIRLTGLLQFIELLALDQLFLLRPQEGIDHRIVIVEINENDINNQKSWPISDVVLTDLLNKIKQQKPRAIGLDIYRNFPVNPGHEDLVKLFQSTPNLIGIQKILVTKDSSLVQPSPILKKLQQVGGNDLPFDDDGKIRRGMLYLYLNKNEYIESLSLKLALLYLKAEGITEEAAKHNPEYLQLGRGVFPRFKTNDGGYVRETAGSYQLLLNYRGTTHNFVTVSLTDVLENRIEPDLMLKKVVIIGSTAESLRDVFYTPYSSKVFADTELMAGVTIHANLTSQILSSAIDGRPQIQSLSEFEEGLWILLWAMIGSILFWQHRHNMFLITVSFMLTGSALISCCFLAFLAGWWIPLIPPILALAGSTIIITQYIFQSAANMQKTFGRYLTDEVVTNLIETPSGLKLGGERRKVTILVSDVRGFSAISEEYPPEKVVEILNLYLELMTDVIHQYKGTINDFMGDGILVMFGAPINREDDSQRAIACAVAMQLAMSQVNAKNQEMNLPILEMGIGINTGEVVAGNIGSQKRAEYTVIGSHVNLAARIESYSVGGQILISEYTLLDANIDLRIDSQSQVEPKGIKQPVTIYEIGGIGAKYNLFLPKVDENIEILSDELPVEFIVLHGKHADGKLLPGALVGLSENGAQLRCKYDLEILTNIKIKLLTETAMLTEEPDIYAKVMKKSAVEENHLLIRFTGIPPKGLKRLQKVRQTLG